MLSLQGVLDVTSVGSVRTLLDRLVAEKKRVVIELSCLRLVDSTGVGAIVSAFKRLRAQGVALIIVGACGQPLAMLRLLRLDRVLTGSTQTASNPHRGHTPLEIQLPVSGS